MFTRWPANIEFNFLLYLKISVASPFLLPRQDLSIPLLWSILPQPHSPGLTLTSHPDISSYNFSLHWCIPPFLETASLIPCLIFSNDPSSLFYALVETAIELGI